MYRTIGWVLLAGALVTGVATPAQAQEAASNYIAVGQMAPDIQVRGATRYGVIEEPVQLSALRGNTVVLAFFFRARTRG